MLVKRRGVGMFVAPGATDLVRRRRRQDFRQAYIAPLLREADHLGLTAQEVITMLTEEDHR